MRRVLRWLPIVFFLGCAVLLGSLLQLDKDAPKESPLIGKPFPIINDVPLLNIDDKAEETTPDHVRFTLYNVFASWCAPCAAEVPFLEELAQLDGVEVVGIAWSDKPKLVKRFLEKNGNPFSRIYNDAKGKWGIELGMQGVPETIGVNEQGKVVFHYSGEITAEDMPDIRAAIDASGKHE